MKNKNYLKILKSSQISMKNSTNFKQDEHNQVTKLINFTVDRKKRVAISNDDSKQNLTMEKYNSDFLDFESMAMVGADDIDFADLTAFIDGTLPAAKRINLEFLLAKKENKFYVDALKGLDKRFKKHNYNMVNTVVDLKLQTQSVKIPSPTDIEIQDYKVEIRKEIRDELKDFIDTLLSSNHNNDKQISKGRKRAIRHS